MRPIADTDMVWAAARSQGAVTGGYRAPPLQSGCGAVPNVRTSSSGKSHYHQRGTLTKILFRSFSDKNFTGGYFWVKL